MIILYSVFIEISINDIVIGREMHSVILIYPEPARKPWISDPVDLSKF